MSQPENKDISKLIRKKAGELGFDHCGIARAGILEDHGKVLSDWCQAGMNADMTYLSRDIKKRINPGLLLPGTRSVIVTGLNYYTERKQGGNGIPVISRYAYGNSYQDVIKGKLDKIIDVINYAMPGSASRSYVDSSPLLEKAWARRAGLGWPGKHSILINRKTGSFFFLGIILTDLELDYNEPESDHCGSCTLCVQACPTGAINSNRTIDTRRCIAYQTIESKQQVSSEIAGKLKGNIFGCDICQEACPWNRKNARPHKTTEFELSPELGKMTSADWKNLEKKDFKKLFRKSAIGRKKFEIFMQNVTIVTK